ncbi:TetR/AcrR family transcriptional regulator [Mumia sp. DW29H23]|uniref:TetR/AcrR family transcriptional regulator n=1 Tax=Mumia sp. DW29H23 TaxID=3421241 RepID=UPI003D68E30E
MTATSRADRRRATEERVLDAARALFAERGFEQTTVRAVAAAAQVDPSLVMQYFGSKRDLFSRAVRAPVESLPPDGPDDVVDRLVESLTLKLGGLPVSTAAMLRSMLTDPEAGDHAREMLGRQVESVAACIPESSDPDLRAALAVTAIVGVTLGHQLLSLPTLQDASVARIAEVFRPAVEALVQPLRSDGSASS